MFTSQGHRIKVRKKFEKVLFCQKRSKKSVAFKKKGRPAILKTPRQIKMSAKEKSGLLM